MSAERLLSHYERIADAPDTIDRLRRFIIDLAVRGKLVPQDSTDEPVSELFRKIISTTVQQQDACLPASWKLVQVASVLISSFYGPRFGAEEYAATGIPTIRTTDMTQDGRIVLRDPPRVAIPENRIGDFRCLPGDLLVTRTGSIGTMAIFNGDYLAVPSAYLIRMRFSQNVCPDYIYLAFKSTNGQTALGLGTTRVAQPNINAKALSAILVPLPPLAEQHRIVAKVNELMSLCDTLQKAREKREAARDRLTATSLARLNAPDPERFQTNARFAVDTLPLLTERPDQIKQVRQTILNLAVRGRLVTQDPADEAASELLKRIANERTGLQAIKMDRRGGDTDILGVRADTLLPIGWRWTNINEIALSMRYGTSTKCEYAAPGVPVLRIPNVSGGVVSLDDIKFGPLTEGEIRDLALSVGDLLLIRSNGSLDIVGRSAIVTVEARGMAFAGYLVRLRLSLLNVDPKYVWLALNSTDVREQIEKPIRSAVGLKNVNLTEFGALTFPLPPVAEQHRIVAKVDALMVLCDRLEASLAAAAASRRQLLDALLAEALAPAQSHEREAAE